MGLLDFSPIGDTVRMAPFRNADLIPVLAITDGSGDVTSISGYATGDIGVSRSGGQYTFTVGIFSRLLAVEASSSFDGASQTYSKVGEDQIRITYPASIASGYISFNCYVDREIG